MQKKSKIIAGGVSIFLLIMTFVILLSTIYTGFGYAAASVTGALSGIGLILIGETKK